MSKLARMLAAAVVIATAVAIPAQAAEYPDGGSDFAVNEQDWVGSDTGCSLAGGTGLCNTTVQHDAAAGNPAGSISVRMAVTVNLLGSFTGAGTWTSPPFTIPSGGTVNAATFQYDRQLAAGGLVTLSPESDLHVELVDLSGSTTTLLDETLTSADSAFATQGVGVPAGAVVAGHSYRLRIVTATTNSTASIGVLGQDNTRFDNVVLAVDQSGPGGGGGGGGQATGGTTPIVSDGVTVTKSFRSDSEIMALFNRYNENTQVGLGPGGSLVALADCTIVGTSKADRITGTSGNDVICGLGGNDVIDGAGGIDIVDGANGNDRLGGGPGQDKLIGLRGNDRLNGHAGPDHMGGGAGRDRVRGAAGADRLGGGKGKDRIAGGAGNDRLLARDRTRDLVNGGAGRDSASVDRLARGARRSRAALRRVDRVVKVERRS